MAVDAYELTVAAGPGARLVFAPGRVNLIGEHTDYNDGFVLPVALDLGITAAFAPSGDGHVRVLSAERGEWAEVSLAAPAPPGRGLWVDYVEGVVRALQRRGLAVPGARIALASTLPEGAGLSSSAALEVATGMALMTLSGGPIDRRALALAGQEAEHRNVGVMTGIMDQLISAMATPGAALLIDCRSLETRAVPMPADLELLVIDTGVKHALASSEYNARRADCARGLRALEGRDPRIRALRDATQADLDAVTLDEVTRRSCAHVIRENARTLRFAEALERGDRAALGPLMAASHASLRDDYRVSCAELDVLVEAAAAEPAVLGARMTGGGFGGCAIALVAQGESEGVARRVGDAFARRFGRRPRPVACRVGGGARLL